MSDRRRPAFTLIELLVVIAIIAVLIGILLPAVQQVRAAAVRTQCLNNLKQLGLAFHQFANDNENAFPPAYLSSQTTPANWGVYLLPYIDQLPLYQQYNFSAPFFYVNLAYGINNQAVVNWPVPTFLCPASKIRGPYSYTFYAPPYPSWQAAPCDYSIYGGAPAEPAPYNSPSVGAVSSLLYNTYVDSTIAPTDTGNPRLVGPLIYDTNTPIINIGDGTSNTILLAETAGKNELFQGGMDTGTAVNGFITGQGGWGDATSGATTFLGSSADGSSSPGNCGINGSNQYGFYSFHTGGVNLLMCDGSVQFKLNNSSIAVLCDLLTANGMEFASQQD
jgi:prepilin-type N-terminal cleavage/methylation domain-containing protein/prepilin-type processing-associated H-X9-DG protein